MNGLRSMMFALATLGCVFLLGVKPTHAQDKTAPDYAKAETWVCRPGHDTTCTTGLDAITVDNMGRRTLQPFVPAKDPAIDCFYVYPTVSLEKTQLADLEVTPEIERVVHEQAGRLSAKCRVFAPVYRQATMASLRVRLAGTPMGDGERSELPLEDVKAAWKYYLEHDNHGRGVVLVGHSQGTLVLQELLKDEIDGKPAQKLLVSAILGGDPSLAAKPGTKVGGTYQHIPACSAAAETGCIYAWGSYLDGTTAVPIFGRPRKDGMVSLCVNPAAPDGGVGMLKFYMHRPAIAPVTDPPYVEAIGQLLGQCRPLNGGNAFVVTVVDGPYASALRDTLGKVGTLPATWGLHPRDMSLVLGNILDVLDAEIASWKK